MRLSETPFVVKMLIVSPQFITLKSCVSGNNSYSSTLQISSFKNLVKTLYLALLVKNWFSLERLRLLSPVRLRFNKVTQLRYRIRLFIVNAYSVFKILQREIYAYIEFPSVCKIDHFCSSSI